MTKVTWLDNAAQLDMISYFFRPQGGAISSGCLERSNKERLNNGIFYDINVYGMIVCEACISDDNLVEWKRIRPRTLFTLSNAADTNLKLKIDH